MVGPGKGKSAWASVQRLCGNVSTLSIMQRGRSSRTGKTLVSLGPLSAITVVAKQKPATSRSLISDISLPLRFASVGHSMERLEYTQLPQGRFSGMLKTRLM